MAAVQAPPQIHRPEMDRSGSFESARRGYDRSTSPISRQSYSPSPLAGPPSHSRTNSQTSSSHVSPFAQPFAHGQTYFTPPPPSFGQHHSFSYPHTPPLSSHPSVNPVTASAWTATPLPASAFYPPSAVPGNGFNYPGQVFHQGFQQSQADFAAWAHAAAYQHMVMASVQQQQQQQYSPQLQQPRSQSPQHQQQQQEYLVGSYGIGEDQRRRTSSGPAVSAQSQGGISGGVNGNGGGGQILSQISQSPFQRRQSLDDRTPPPLITQLINSQPRSVSDKLSPSTSAPGGFHPYKRTPGHRPSKESLRTNPQANVLPRTRSQPSLSAHTDRAAVLAKEQHQRTPSLDSGRSEMTVQAPPPRPSIADDGRRDSSATERAPKIAPRSTSNPNPVITAPAPVVAPAPKPSAIVRASTPLQSGQIAAGTNTPQPRAAAPTPSPAPAEKKSGGLKSRFAKVLNKDKSKSTASSSVPTPIQSPAKAPAHSYPHTSPSEASTRSGTPPRTPPQDLHPPSAPFAIHTRAMDSEISLAETGRTERVDDGEKKQKRGLFRMKNMSTDNISLSSTVSSASMMIRKMGSIGKLARRNSLMGISKIFKDKPKDEDAALPEVEGKLEKKERKEKEKKEKKDKKKGKGEIPPTQVTRISADVHNDDRTLTGLSPAATLARQHTLRSKAANGAAPAVGEPTWDNNTVNSTNTGRSGAVLPSLGSVVPSPTSPTSGQAPEVMLVQPRNISGAATVHHAVNVSEAEYDSEDDDSSDGETVEDVTFQMGRSKLSDEADQEFRTIWGNTYIDPRLVPKKGILKAKRTYENTPTDSPKSSRPPSTASTTRPALAEQSLNGSSKPLISSPSTHVDFDFFDAPPPALDLAHPNTSLPSLPAAGTIPRQPAVRAMTVPVSRRILWAPDCAVYTTYDAGTYDRRSEPATCNRLTPDLAMEIKRELNEFKAVMPVHPESTIYTHFFK